MASPEVKIRLALDGAGQVQAGVQGAAQSLDKLGQAQANITQQTKLTGNQTAQLSAQLQDLFVQIQAGGSPMTALIQQGSQLSAVFGGTGNALRAVASLVSPAAVALGGLAAVVGVVTYGYAAGSKEAQEFNKALVLSGNAAGATVNQLSALSSRLGGLAGSQAKASEALTQFVQAGVRGVDGLERYTAAALRLEKVGGDSIEKTAKAFAELGKDPLQASIKLNESVNFLTASTYSQIKALEEQGRATDAATLAQDAFANAINERAPQIEAKLGSIERKFKAIADGARALARDANDALLSIGREETPQDRRDAAQRAIAQANSKLYDIKFGQGVLPLFDSKSDAIREQQQIIDNNKVILQDVEERLRREGRIAEAQRLQTAQLEAQIRADKVLAEYGDKRNRQANEEKRVLEALSAIGADQLTKAKALAEVRKKFADKDAGKAFDAEAEALEKAVGLSGRYYKDLAELNKLRQQGKLIGDAYVEAVTKLTAAQPVIAKSAKEEADAIKQVADARLRGAQIHDAYINELERSAESAARQVTALQDEERALGLAAQKNITLAQAIQEVAIARLEEQKTAAQNDPAALAQLQREIDARRELIGLIGSREARDANKRSAEDMARDWERISNQVGQSLSDAIMQGGRSARDYLKGLFRQLVLQPLLQPLVQPIAGLIASASNGAGATGAGGMNGAGGALGALQQGYSAYSNYGAALGTAFFGNSAAYGGVLASGAATGAGSQAAMLAAQTGEFGFAGLSATQSAAAGATGYSGATAGASAGNAAWAAYWPLLIVAGMLASNDAYKAGFNEDSLGDAGKANPLLKARTDMWESLFGRRTANIITGASLTSQIFGRAGPRVEGTGITGSIRGGDFTGEAYADIIEKGGIFRSDKRYTQTSPLDADLGKALDEGASALLESAKKYGAALGLPAQELGNISAEFKVKFTEDAADNAKAVAEALQKYSDALIGTFAADVEPLRKSGETVTQTIERVGGALLGVNDVLKQLDLGLLTTTVAGGKAATELIDLFGGLDNLNQSAGAYYQAYYSEAERAQKATAILTSTLAEVGQAVPANRDAYRDLVEAQDLNTEAGRKAFQVLLSMAGVFDALAVAGDEANAKLAEQQAQRRAEVSQERLGLETQMLQVQGKTLELRHRERDALDVTNRALYDQINALEDLAGMVDSLRSAAEAAMSAVERAVSAQQASLRKAYDTQIKAIEAQADALNAAFDATAERVAGQRKAAQDAYTQQTAGIRASLSALEATEKARAAEYRAAVDAVAAERKAAQTAYTQAATRLQDTIRTTTETVGRLRGLNDSLKSTISALRPLGSEATDRARAQAQIRDALASARSGGALPQAEDLRDALSAISRPSEELFASFQDYARDFFRTSIDLRDLQKISGSQLDEAQAQLSATISLKDALDAANVANLERLDGIREALDLANEQARTAYDLQRESLQGQLDAARTTLDSTLAGLDAQLTAAQEARDKGLDGLEGEREALTVQLEADLSALDDILTEARRQYDATMGVNSSVLSVRDAVQDLNTALTALAAATGKPAPTLPTATTPATGQWVTSGQVQTWQDAAGAVAAQPVGNTNNANTIIKATDGQVFSAQQAIAFISANIGNAEALKAASTTTGIGAASVDALMGWTAGTFAALTDGGSIKGLSVADIRAFVTERLETGDLAGIHARAVQDGITSRTLDALMGWQQGTALAEALRIGLPAFAAGGSHTGGVRLVGEQGPEIEVTGPSRIYSFDQLMQLAGGTGRDETLVREVQALRRELAELRAAGQVTAANTGKAARALDRWDQDGIPEERTL